MPNWSFVIMQFFYLLALSLWIGGGVALGALTAPVLFQNLERPVAGRIFGQILRRFARIRIGAAVILVAAALARSLLFEPQVSVWHLIRWIAIAVMAGEVVYSVLYLQPAIERSQAGIESASPEGRAAAKAGFDRLHRRAETLMKASILAAVVALLFS